MSAVTTSRLAGAAVAVLLVGLAADAAPVPPAAPPNPNGRGYLGLYFATGVGDSLGIDRLVPGMPAAKAGLRAGDVFVRVNGFRPQGSGDMIEHIKAYRPGATVEVEVLRGAERKTFRVTLTARPPEADFPQPVPVIPGDPFRR